MMACATKVIARTHIMGLAFLLAVVVAKLVVIDFLLFSRL